VVKTTANRKLHNSVGHTTFYHAVTMGIGQT